MTLKLIVLILYSSFTNDETAHFKDSPKKLIRSYISENSPIHSLNSEKTIFFFTPVVHNQISSATYLQNANSDQMNNSNLVSTNLNFAYPYFPLIYSGFGVDHMNINLVNIIKTGLIVGDEIGIFDGKSCVGSAVLGDQNMKENSLSIPASANENLGTKANGYIEGHKITLKIYRGGTVYILYFQTVNNSTDTFERGGSMFALIDFSRSEKESTPEDSQEQINIYPNPFDTNLRIEVNLPKAQQLNCEIFDITGKLIKTLYDGIAEGQQLLIWDGKDNSKHQVSIGIYFCRLNKSTIKIIYNK